VGINLSEHCNKICDDYEGYWSFLPKDRVDEIMEQYLGLTLKYEYDFTTGELKNGSGQVITDAS